MRSIFLFFLLKTVIFGLVKYGIARAFQFLYIAIVRMIKIRPLADKLIFEIKLFFIYLF